jgi:hypothetical protein
LKYPIYEPHYNQSRRTNKAQAQLLRQTKKQFSLPSFLHHRINQETFSSNITIQLTLYFALPRISKMKLQTILLYVFTIILGFMLFAPALMTNKTKQFLGSKDQWIKAKIAFNDSYALWSNQNRIFEITSKDAYFQECLKVFIDNDFVSIKLPSRSGVPDEGRPTIALINSEGKKVEITAWENDLRDENAPSATIRLAKIYAFLLKPR